MIINATDYSVRNQLLGKLGFPSYKDYLASDLWRAIRSRVFEMHGGLCFLCDGKANQIHHHKYTLKNLRGAFPQAMFPLCGDCHKLIEFNEDGTKRSLKETKIAFSAMKRLHPKKNKKRAFQQKRWRYIPIEGRIPIPK